MIKKVSILIAVIMVTLVSHANAFGFDDAKRAKLQADITAVFAKNGSSDVFLKCVSTKDPYVYSIILDKNKMANLKDLPVKDLQRIDDVENACKVS